MSEKKKVFLSFVGKRDPYDVMTEFVPECKASLTERAKCLFSGCSPKMQKREKGKTEGSILSICKELHPDIVYLFPSEGKTSSTSENAKEVVRILEKENKEIRCSILPLHVDDPTDFEALSLEFGRNVRQAAAELGDLEAYSHHLNCSSGTQQMSTLAYVFANSGMFPGIERWQCKDPQFSGTRIRKINTLFLEEHSLIQKVRRNLLIYAFHSISDDCAKIAEISPSLEQRAAASFLSKVFNAYSLLDILRYQDAAVELRKGFGPGQENLVDDERKGLVYAQIRLLEELMKGGITETADNLTDLYFNMNRCYERGAYADVLARFWRVGEGSVYFRLASEWGINPRNLDGSPNKDNLRRLREHQEFKPGYHKAETMGFDRGRTVLLNVFDDDVYRDLWQSYSKKIYSRKTGKTFEESEIKKLIQIRNETNIAHGMKSVSKEQADKCLDIAEAMLLVLVPEAEQRIQTYPFKMEDLEKLIDILDRPQTQRR